MISENPIKYIKSELQETWTHVKHHVVREVRRVQRGCLVQSGSMITQDTLGPNPMWKIWPWKTEEWQMNNSAKECPKLSELMAQWRKEILCRVFLYSAVNTDTEYALSWVKTAVKLSRSKSSCYLAFFSFLAANTGWDSMSYSETSVAFSIAPVLLLIKHFQASQLHSPHLLHWILRQRSALGRKGWGGESIPESPEHTNTPQLLHNLPGACNLAEA